MADPTKAETTVNLSDGRTITLVFDINAWIDIADQMGMEVPDVLEMLSDKDNPPSLKFQRTIMWGGLQKHHPEMTVRDAGEILVEAADAMAKSMAGGMPTGEDGDEADPPKPRGGTGTKPKPPGRG